MMDEYTISELSYKNGYEKAELCTRVKVAYEQLSEVHTLVCKNYKRGIQSDKLLHELQDTINKILDVQVTLGMIAKE